MIPSEIKVLNHIYKVIEVDEISDDIAAEDKEKQGDQILGLLDDTALQILLVKDVQPSRKYQIFLHEIVHAIFNIIEFRRFLKDQESEDTIVNAVSDILFQVITENNLNPTKKSLEHRKVGDDPNLVNTIKYNYEKGISVKDLCKTFHLSEKELKSIIKGCAKEKKKKIRA